MEILHAYSGNLWGGIERTLLNLAEFQARSRELSSAAPAHQHEFALCFPGHLWSGLEAAGAVCHALGPVRFSRPWSVWSARRRLCRLLATRHYDAVLLHASWPYAALAPAVKACGLPRLWAAHDIADGRHWLDRRVIRNPPQLALANSRYTAAAWRRWLPASQIEVWYPPMMPPPALDENERGRQRRRWQTTPESLVILIAGRLEPMKGHRVLLQALAALPPELDWTAWIAGAAQRPREARYRQALEEQAHRRGIAPRLRWLGMRADLGAVMSAADVFCQPNLKPDAMAWSVIEALAHRLPVIASDLGGPAEILAGGETGLLVPPGEPPALAQALERLWRAPALRLQLGQNGARRARQLTDAATQAEQLYHYLLPFASMPKAKTAS